MSRRTALFPLLIGATLLVGNRESSSAQALTVNFGSYLSPTATNSGFAPFLISYNCFPLTPPGQQQQCDVEERVYSASPFAAALHGSQAIDISSFAYFSSRTFFSGILSNTYSVFMGAGAGPLSFFGTFSTGACDKVRHDPGVQCGLPCGSAPSLTCMPDGAGASGGYLYDPSLGDLHIRMVETLDWFNGFPQGWWEDEYTPGGSRGLVTQFNGAVVATPEPTSLALVATGMLLIAALARRRSIQA